MYKIIITLFRPFVICIIFYKSHRRIDLFFIDSAMWVSLLMKRRAKYIGLESGLEDEKIFKSPGKSGKNTWKDT